MVILSVHLLFLLVLVFFPSSPSFTGTPFCEELAAASDSVRKVSRGNNKAAAIFQRVALHPA